MHPRLPLTLFLDDPLDLCLFGRALGGGPAGAAHAPFDTTTVAALPERGGMLILVDAGGLEVAPAPAEPTPPHEEESP